MAFIMRNWLSGVYGDKPLHRYPSLKPLLEIEVDFATALAECANSIFSIIKEEMNLCNDPRIVVAGGGNFAENVADELLNRNAKCLITEFVKPRQEADVMFLLLNQNSLTPALAETIACKVLVELLPGQINPECDEILCRRGITVVPDVMCSCIREIIENWWVSGKRVPDWPMAMYLRLSSIWEDIGSMRKKYDLCCHDAAIALSLQRISLRLGI
jgi:hypothetical protein